MCLNFDVCNLPLNVESVRRWPSGRVLAYRAQGHGFTPWPSHILKTLRVDTRCLPAKHSALKGMVKRKWCKSQG